MRLEHFDVIIKDMEFALEGDAYEIVVALSNGEILAGPWKYLNGAHATIVIDIMDKGADVLRPHYVDVACIVRVSCVPS